MGYGSLGEVCDAFAFICSSNFSDSFGAGCGVAEGGRGIDVRSSLDVESRAWRAFCNGRSQYSYDSGGDKNSVIPKAGDLD
jgi:hypothetical protein